MPDQIQVEAYLAELRRRLRGMKSDDADEVIQELRGHILDRLAAAPPSAADVHATLAKLGAPAELAPHYIASYFARRAEVSRSSLSIVQSLFHWASLSIAGCGALVGAITGYFLGGALVLCAASKPFHMLTAGLWAYPDVAGDTTYSLRLGFGQPPPGAHDVLGWTVVPLGLVFGCALVVLTTRMALWLMRQFRLGSPLRPSEAA